MQNLLAALLVATMVFALETMRKNNLEAVWVNDQQEVFTSENLCSVSVGGNKERYCKVTRADAITRIEAHQNPKKVEGGDDWSKLSKAGLAEKMDEYGLSYSSKMSKEEMIAALEAFLSEEDSKQ